MQVDLRGKVAIVTGAGGIDGIGATYARALAANGARVLVADLNEEGACAVACSIDGARAFRVDITDPDSVDSMVNFAEDELGPLDIMINNAGYMKPVEHSLLDYPLELWNLTMAVNLTGTYHCLRAAAKRMIERGRGGRIVNQSSIGGYLPGHAYSISKTGVMAMSAAFAQELGPHGITVNVIAPGAIDTPGGRAASPKEWNDFASTAPIKPIAPPEDLVSALLFFCAEESGFVTGQVLRVDGGLTRQIL